MNVRAHMCIWLRYSACIWSHRTDIMDSWENFESRTSYILQWMLHSIIVYFDIYLYYWPWQDASYVLFPIVLLFTRSLSSICSVPVVTCVIASTTTTTAATTTMIMLPVLFTAAKSNHKFHLFHGAKFWCYYCCCDCCCFEGRCTQDFSEWKEKEKEIEREK